MKRRWWWCANLLGIEVMRLKEILQDVSSHYREFWIRKRRGGYRMISAPDKELKAIQDTIYHRILLSVNVHPAATGFRRQHSIVDNVRPHLGKRCVLKTDIHDFFISIRSPRVKRLSKRSAIRRIYRKCWASCVVCVGICRKERLPVRY